jgi:hypothetical protein
VWVLRIVVNSTKEEVTGGWIKLHNQEFHNVYFSPNIKMIKSWRLRLARHVARVAEVINL